MQINVKQCPSCDRPHENVSLHEYSGKRAAWNNWYTCPVSGDPVSVLVEVEGGKPFEVEPAIVESLMRARKAGKYVIAVFRRESTPDGMWQTHCVQHPHDWPQDQFGECVNLLKQAFDKVVGPPAKEQMTRGKPEPKVTLWKPVPMAAITREIGDPQDDAEPDEKDRENDD